MGREWTRGRYRWRTRLRVALPWALVRWVPKGGRDCGNHEWYKQDEATEACYHCRATRPWLEARSD